MMKTRELFLLRMELTSTLFALLTDTSEQKLIIVTDLMLRRGYMELEFIIIDYYLSNIKTQVN